MRRHAPDSEEFAQKTAVMDALPHAIHPIHEDWRTKADALIDGLRARGWDVTRRVPSAEAQA